MRRGWPPVIAHAAVTGVTQILWLTYAPITSDSAAHYDVSETAITWLANVYPVLYFLLAIPIGLLLDRRPARVLALGAGLVGAGAVVRLLGGYGPALIGQTLGAIAQPVLFGGIVVVARYYLDEQSRPAGIAAGTVGAFVGLVAGIVLPSVLAEGPEIGMLLAVEAVLAVACAAVMLILVRPRPIEGDEALGALSELRGLWSDRAVRGLALLSFAGFGIFATLLTVLEPLLGDRGISSDDAGIVVLVMTICGIATSLVVPAIVIRRGLERAALTGAVSGAALVTALLGLAWPLAGLVALSIVIGALLLPALPVLLEVGERRHPAAGGTLSAIIFLAGNLGVGLLTVLAMSLDQWQAVPFLMLGAAGLVALLFARPGLRDAVGP